MRHPNMKGRTGLLFSLIIAVYFCGVAARPRECENATLADIVFLVDGSSSISSGDFQKIRTFLHKIISDLDIGDNKVRVGLAQYGDEPVQEFLLKDHKDKRFLLAALNRLSQQGGGTNTGKAIDFLQKRYFTNNAGSRANKRVPQIAVVITDGESMDDVKGPAQHLRDHGVIVFGIGVGQANQEQLQSIVNWPPSRFLLTIDSYEAMEREKERLLQTVCVTMEQQRKALAEKFADIFFLVDSGIAQGNFSQFRTELTKLINQLNVKASTYRIGLAQYGQNIQVEFLLNAFQTKHEAVAGVKRFRLRPPQPNEPRYLGYALQYARTYFFNSEVGGRAEQGFRQFLVIVSGKASDDSVSTEARKMKLAGVTVIWMSAGAPMDKIDLLSDQYAFDSVRVTLLKDLFMTEEKEAITKDCKIGNMADVVFIVDESGSIGKTKFQLVRDFLHSIVSSLDVAEKKVQVGIVTYNEAPTAQAYLNTLNDKTEILQFIKLLPYNGGETNTGKALNFTRDEIFTEQRGMRKGVQQVAVVITDGESQDDVSNAAITLRQHGVTVFAVGIGNANKDELNKMASHPSREHVFYVSSFTLLKPLKEKLQRILCKKIIDKKVCEADFFFLIDDSESISDVDFNDMKKFIIEFLRTLNVGPQNNRIGLVKYSDSPTLEFDLTDHTDADALEKAVEGIHHGGGGTKTGQALSSMGERFKRHARVQHGNKVPQYLIVITDGESQDGVQAPAQELRKQGITIYAIGVKESNKNELDDISGDSKRTFNVTTYDALTTLIKDITADVCSPDVCKGDVIFLTDSSESISEEDFQKMKDFMKSVIKKIGRDGVQVGVMQYSTNNDLQFPLNNNYKKDQMFKVINDMKQMKEGTHTGKAITAVSQYFDKDQGGRRELQQRLVVITDGKSNDDVKGPAAALRKKGVTIYAIGVSNANSTELEEISSEKKFYYVEDYDALKDWENQLASEICNPGCSIDIAIGFDISQRVPAETLIKHYATLLEIFKSISSVVGLNLTETKTNIAFPLVDRYGHFLYDTNFEAYREDMLQKIMQISEPSYFNTALLNSFQKMFKEKSKARVKVLVIFSDGLDEDVTSLKLQSEQLRKSKVSALLTVALEGAHNPNQLQKVEFGRGFDYHKHLSITMPNIASTVYQQIIAVSERECCSVMCKCTGNVGPRGPPGSPGPKGDPGREGGACSPGEEGDPGDRGPPGPAGPPGTKGCAGARGEKGKLGVSGDRGEDGEDGLDGINGEQGEAGRKGSQGERGHPGNPGIPGTRGEEGLKGERGLRGDPGEPGTTNTNRGTKGEPGNPGLPGSSGPHGKKGDDGVYGNPGPDGRRGRPGVKGRPGLPGASGLPGIPGASGPQGRIGEFGERGPKGNHGFPGPQGEHGKPGGLGLPGYRGPNGQKGQPGDPGGRGGPGSRGPRGMPGQDGADGRGCPGSKGAKGDPGFPGYPGLQGEEGQKGTKGHPGRDGNRGRRGNSGRPGESGRSGDPGYPGHRGPKGPPGVKGVTECDLITKIRENCACCHGQSKCLAYPTELVFGLDMSLDVTEEDFVRQRNAVTSLLEDISITESNCPTGARVTVVGYGDHTNYLIRFQDYRRKTQLNDSVANIVLERTNRRHLGAAMSFVGQNVFKHSRASALTRKVAVFFSNGESQDDILSAIMEYRGLNIVPAIISLKNAHDVHRAMEVDDTGHSIFTVLRRPQDDAANLRKVKNCAICFDPCKRSEECASIQEPVRPQSVNMDLMMVADGSREVQADEFAGIQQLLGSVVEQLVVSSQPDWAGHTHAARVAVVQQSGTRTRVEFGLQEYQSHQQMKTHLVQTMQQQGGSSLLGQTLESSLRELLKTSQPRRKRVMMTVVGSQTAYTDQKKLHYISQKAKCEGVAMFVVTVGEHYNRTQVEELASLPVQQHLIHVGRLKADEQGYAQRFFRVFLSALNKGINSYPPPSLKRTCNQLTELRDEDQLFHNGDGSAELMDEYVEERFEEQMGVKTWTTQPDVIDISTVVDRQSLLLGTALNETCLLKHDAGSCQSYTMMWFFDNERGECSRFWYGGCGGNSNRFETRKACEKLCLRR